MTNDGGPAFPVLVPVDYQFAEVGMSLRDWFAGQVLGEVFRMVMALPSSEDPSTWAAAAAYEIADAMLAERGKQNDQSKADASSHGPLLAPSF